MANEKVNLAEVLSFQQEQSTQTRQLRQGIHEIQASLRTIRKMTSFKGEAADAANMYFEELHGTLLDAFEGLFIQLEKNVQTHIREFRADVDASEKAKVERLYIDQLENKIENTYTDLNQVMRQIERTIQSVSDITRATAPPTFSVKDHLNETLNVSSKLTRQLEMFSKSGKRERALVDQSIREIETLLTKVDKKTGKTRTSDWFQSNLSSIQSFVVDAKLSPAFSTLLNVKAESGQVQKENGRTNGAQASLSSLGLQKYVQSKAKGYKIGIEERVLTRLPLLGVLFHYRQSPHEATLNQLNAVGAGLLTDVPYFDVKLNRYPIKSQGTAHENWWLKTTTHLVDQGNWLLDKVKGWNIPIINNRINRIETNIGIIEEMILREYQLKKPIYDFLAGTGMGIGRAGLDMVLGLWELVTDPIGTIKA